MLHDIRTHESFHENCLFVYELKIKKVKCHCKLMKIVFWYWIINFSLLIFHCRLLWRRFECHNCVCCVLYAREQSTKLQIYHGQFIQVSVYLNSLGLVSKAFWAVANGIFLWQVCHRHTGAFGRWELYDCVFEWGHISEKDANRRLAQKVLSADW